MKFTPGKWLVEGQTVYALNEYGYNVFRARFEDANTHPLELAANATLTSAAPDLYRQLKYLVTLLEPLEKNGALNVPGLTKLHGARFALAKAKAT